MQVIRSYMSQGSIYIEGIKEGARMLVVPVLLAHLVFQCTSRHCGPTQNGLAVCRTAEDTWIVCASTAALVAALYKAVRD